MPKKNQHAQTAEASNTSTALALPHITRSQAQQMLVARATALYDRARTEQANGIGDFECQYGRCDRIDNALLQDLQSMQMRFAAIAARQRRGTYGEPKVSKYVEQIGVMIGSLSAHLATDRAMELFAPIDKRDYLGWNRNEIGEKGRDESVLAGYVIVDDELPSAESELEGPCVRHEIEPIEDEPGRGICVHCDQEFALGDDCAQAQAAA